MTLRAENLSMEDVPPAISIAKCHNNNSLNLKNGEPEKMVQDASFSFKTLSEETKNRPCVQAEKNVASDTNRLSKAVFVAKHAPSSSPQSTIEFYAVAVKLQKVYKSYRTRRHIADCAVVVEELWWKALDYAALKMSSVSFFEKPETAVSRWSRARTRAAKVGKGLSKYENAQKLALQHWLEAIDPRHRYGHNLHLYYEVWFNSESIQPFFYWLDIGNGKDVNLEECPRVKLQRQCIKYLGPKERESFEVLIHNGKLIYKQSGVFVNSDESSKWIFVLSTTRTLYVGQKQKGRFQHSSFLAGGAITAAGRLVARDGFLEAIWPYSGHYFPTEDNFNEFLSFLEEHSVDLANINTYAAYEENPPISGDADTGTNNESIPNQTPESASFDKEAPASVPETQPVHQDEKPLFQLSKRVSRKWSTGAGPRIGCVREYPAELQFRALEQVQISPRGPRGPLSCYGPIPSPRPSPKLRLSPSVACMGLPSPRTPVSKGQFF